MAAERLRTVSPIALHFGRQSGQRLLHAVVDVDRVDVGIGAQFETDGQAVAAVVARCWTSCRSSCRRRRSAASIGCATVASTTAADAPAKVVEIVTCGGTMSGNCDDRDAQQRQHARQRHQDGDDDRQARAIDEDGRDHAATCPGAFGVGVAGAAWRGRGHLDARPHALNAVRPPPSRLRSARRRPRRWLAWTGPAASGAAPPCFGCPPRRRSRPAGRTARPCAEWRAP